ncbi:hypothetical protein NPIL_650821, partial [Nephila pilipes]
MKTNFAYSEFFEEQHMEYPTLDYVIAIVESLASGVPDGSAIAMTIFS